MQRHSLTTAGDVSAYAGKRVLVTGGLGFIGSNLAIRLIELGAEVLIVDALLAETGANPFNLQPVQDHGRLAVRIVDIRDALAMERLARGQQIIFNLAGQVSHLDSMQDPFTDLEINCRSQLALLEACRRSAPETKLVFASTRQIYGRVSEDALPISERQIPNPIDVNGINKLAGERYHILYNNVYGLRASVLRLTNTYGPRMLVQNNRQTFLGWFVRLALDDQEITVYGDGRQLRDATYVDDVVDALLVAGASDAADGQIFNLGGTRPMSLLDIANSLVEVAGTGTVRQVPWPAERKSIDIGSVHMDDTKIRQVLGWRTSVDWIDGLRQTVAFYRAHRARYWSERHAPAVAA